MESLKKKENFKIHVDFLAARRFISPTQTPSLSATTEGLQDRKNTTHQVLTFSKPAFPFNAPKKGNKWEEAHPPPPKNKRPTKKCQRLHFLSGGGTAECPTIGRTPTGAYSQGGVLGTFWKSPSQNPF